MQIKTKYYGEIEIEEEKIIHFAGGIPGFVDEDRYIMIRDEETDFAFFQSVKTEDLCFITLPPALIVGEYTFELSEETVEKLELESPEEALVYTVLNIPDDFKKMTGNLRAPFVVNTKNNKAVQELLDDEKYSVRHMVFKGEQ